MKLVKAVFLTIALAGASTSFADAPAAKSSRPMASADEIKHAEAFFDELVNAVVKNQDACPKMGPAVNAVLDKHEAWLRKMAEADKDLPQATKDKFQKRQTEMTNGVTKCASDPGVSAAFQRFGKISAAKKSEK